MNEEQKNWFDKLYYDRNNTANALMKSFAIGNMWNSVVEKYSDQAHFIYELLQNANDVQATVASFNLTENGLYFKHNGKKHFWVSNPENEHQDQENNKLGDLNAITAVAQSNKKDLSTIGKFGVGFKAVFQYTNTPHIYEPNFLFKIRNYIVPEILDIDLPERNQDETVFYFPFDKEEISKENAYSDILGKLKKMGYPTLFLNNLESVSWKTEFNEQGVYSKEIEKKETLDNIKVQKIVLNKNEKLLLLTRSIENSNLNYSIGYFLDEKGKLTPKKLDAFCFFPTKETTNLNFILHAPFLLIDSRESIHRSKEHNFDMIKLLAQLAADSLLILKDLKLIDDDIFKIIPYKKPAEDDFFAPFYYLIKDKFQTEELLPAKNGSFAMKKNAYWASVPKIADLFSNEQLTEIIKEEGNNKWVFITKGRDEILRGDKELSEYIGLITNNWINEDDILTGWTNVSGKKQEGITKNFIEKQSNEWLFSFYKWIIDTEGRKKTSKEKPFFLNKDRLAVSAFNQNGKLILFFPDNDGDGYETLNADLFNKAGKQLFANFGIREYTVADDLEIAISKFKNNQLNPESFFSKAFKYFKKECPQDKIDDFIEKIINLSFIPFYTQDEKYGMCLGNKLFYPTEKLVDFYEQKADTQFADIKSLQEKYPSSDHKTLNDFIKKLGVNDKDPELKDSVYKIVIPKLKDDGDFDTVPLFKILFQYYRECKNEDVDEFIINIKDLKFVLYFNTENKTISRGLVSNIYYPTDDLLAYFETKPNTNFVALIDYHKFIIDENEQQILKEFLLKLGVAEYPRIIKKTEKILVDGCWAILEDIRLFKSKEKSILLWNILVKLQHNTSNLNTELIGNYLYKNSTEGTLNDLKKGKWLLSKDGVFVAPHEITIHDLDDIYTNNFDLEELLEFQSAVVLSQEEQIVQMFDSFEDAELAKRLLEEYKTKQYSQNEESDQLTSSNNDFNDNSGIEWLKNFTKENNNYEDNDDEKVVNVITHERSMPNSGSGISVLNEDKEFAIALEIVAQKFEVQKQRIELAENINNCEKYSYDWFKAYLKLLTTYSEKQDTTKQKSITFQEIKNYKTDNKYFLLCGASSYISPDIENAADFKVSLVFGNGKKEFITVEGVSKKGQDLLIYCREGISLNILSRLSNVFKIEINFTPVIDLLDRLYKAFTNSNNIIEWEDINIAMPALNYIYGPPGTGKTTTLCNNINEIFNSKPNAKILVLTPTNKAADVVCKKILDINTNISAVRLSRPTDPELEENQMYRDTLNDVDLEKINVVASTIHRLPYFDITNYGLLFQYQWDYVIFDESSMTGLHYITFAIMSLFKTNPNVNFIIAGDPKQIPPVIEINDKELENFDFQDESIYKMMNLESFNPDEQIIREFDNIKNLETQYRSIPKIGQLFSELSYSGLLKHDRETNRRETKPLPEKVKNIISSNVTFIDIPLDKDSSIFKVSKLIYSSYQIYCSVLVAEIIKYFDNANDNEKWTIGLIAPYKAQAILLNKLITSYGISENIKVYADTVHGFQGDECDIVFFVCNPNNYRYTNHPKSLLSKEYIYNVAISRAKDYLIVLHPYEAIKNNRFINDIKYSSRTESAFTKSEEIEKVLFDEDNHIEKNSYVSGHDNVNIFGLSEMKYFIKSNETAIDIQLRDFKEHNINDLTIQTNTIAENK